MAHAIDAALSKSDDSAEWAGIVPEFDGTNCGVKHSNALHPDSAYAHLPMRGIAHSKASTRTNSNGVGGVYVEVSAEVQKRNAIALWPELRAQKRAPIESKSKPHPDSAYADLPLCGLGLDRTPGGFDLFDAEVFERPPYCRKTKGATHKWTLTVAEKRSLAARPLRYTAA